MVILVAPKKNQNLCHQWYSRCLLSAFWCMLTLSVPHFFLTVAKMGLPKRSAPYWSNPPFNFLPECQKIKNGGFDQYSPELNTLLCNHLTLLGLKELNNMQHITQNLIPAVHHHPWLANLGINPFNPGDVSNGYNSKRSRPYWSSPPFLIFDIWALWRSGLSARVPECQKLKNGGLDQYVP